jgi:predicted RecB family nuclease
VAELPPLRHPEIVLSASLGEYRLLAKYDLIAIQPGQRAIIVDWKTSQRKPARSTLEKRLQTIVYRFLLVETGKHLHGGQSIKPEQVEMAYWFAIDPDNPEHFPYDDAHHQEAGKYLLALVEEIEGRKVFDLTTETKRCQFCTYRSLCERGIRAGDERDMDADFDDAAVFDIDLDFDQIAEIEF